MTSFNLKSFQQTFRSPLTEWTLEICLEGKKSLEVAKSFSGKKVFGFRKCKKLGDPSSGKIAANEITKTPDGQNNSRNFFVSLLFEHYPQRSDV